MGRGVIYFAYKRKLVGYKQSDIHCYQFDFIKVFGYYHDNLLKLGNALATTMLMIQFGYQNIRRLNQKGTINR